MGVSPRGGEPRARGRQARGQGGDAGEGTPGEGAHGEGTVGEQVREARGGWERERAGREHFGWRGWGGGQRGEARRVGVR